MSATSEPAAVVSGPGGEAGTPLAITSLALLDADGTPGETCEPRAPLTVRAELRVDAPIVLDVALSLAIYHAASGVLVYAANLQRDGWDVCWLPQGSYTVTCCFPSLGLLAGSYVVRLDAVSLHGGERAVLDSTGDRCRLQVVDPRGEEGLVLLDHAWQISSGAAVSAPRPLDPGWRRGLFFLHPGLYYSARGHHLAEFSPEPHVHLKRSPEELRRLVLEGSPSLMDRGGLEYTPGDFWRYYAELVPITVRDIEAVLRRLGFEFRKVAVRTDDVAYTPELQAYPIQDLTTAEIYLVVVNRKRASGCPMTV